MNRIIKLTCSLLIGLLLSCGGDDGPTPLDLVTITVEDFSTAIDENPDNGTILGTVEASASDGSSPQFTLTEQSVDGAISIDPTTGELSVRNASAFDFEIFKSITATVTASVDTVSEAGAITITINDVEDGASLFANNFTASVNENPSAGQTIGTVQAGSSENTTLTYSLVDQSVAGAIGINSTTGVISVADPAVFDFETRQTITGTYEVTDGSLEATGDISITINDMDDNISVTANDFTASVNENPTNGQVIGTVDASSSNNSTLTYSLTSQSVNGALAINASTGELSVADAAAFDFEVNTSLTATYEVTDGTLTESANITVTINNVAETGWQTVGNEDFTVGGTEYIQLVFNGSQPVVAFHDDAADGRGRLMSFDGIQWSNKGPAASTGRTDWVELIIQNGQEVIAYRDDANGDKLTVKRLTPSLTWETLGTEGFSAGEVIRIGMDVDDDGRLYVTYWDQSLTNQIVVQYYNENNNTWNTVGNTGSGMSGFSDISINSGNLPLIVYQETGSLNGFVKIWNGGNWAGVGPTIPKCNFPRIDFTDDGSEYAIAYADGTQGNKLSVRLNVNNSWLPYGSPVISDGLAQEIDLILNGSRAPVVSFADDENRGLTVMRWNGASQSWDILGSKGFTGTVGYTAMAIHNDDIYVAYTNGGSGKVTVKKWVEE